jgi:hypothetical protein
MTNLPMKLHVLFAGLLFGTLVVFASSGRAQPPSGGHDGLTTTNCVEQLRKGISEWIECDGAFQPDANGRADLSKMTLNFVTDAKCGGKLRVRRKEFNDARTAGGVLELPPQDVLCIFFTTTEKLPPVTVTLAPKLTFRSGKVLDVSPQILKIADLPDFLVMPLRSATESDVARGQLTKGVNAFLERAYSQ